MGKAIASNKSGNRDRFPPDFAFVLTAPEWEILRSQFATSSWGGRGSPPHAFTEHGALMAAAVLNSRRAIEVSIFVVRTSIAMREVVADTRELANLLGSRSRLRFQTGTSDAIAIYTYFAYT